MSWGERDIQNAKITSVSFGREEHGIMSCTVHLEYAGGGQGFGGYALDEYDAAKKRRVGTAYGMEWIMRLMDVLEVRDFSDLPGTLVRADQDWQKVYRIGHYMKNQWFDPENDLKHVI